MIFKSEQPKIQRIVTDTVIAEKIDPTFPFEYRLEFEASEKERILKEFPEGASWRKPEDLAVAKYIGVPLPPISDKTRTRIASKIIPSIKNALKRKFDNLSGEDVRFLFVVALLDVTFLRSNEEPLRSLVRELIESYAYSLMDPPTWRELALLRLIAPDTDMPFATLRSIEGMEQTITGLNNPDHWDREFDWEKVLENLAYARIAGVHEFPWKSLDWPQARHLLFTEMSRKDTQKLAENIFYARVLNAKKVWVDTEDLHIDDPDLPASLQNESRPIPSPKHL